MKTTTVEERLTRIEREFEKLKHEVLGIKPRAKSWRQTVGAIPDYVISRSAVNWVVNDGNVRQTRTNSNDSFSIC